MVHPSSGSRAAREQAFFSSWSLNPSGDLLRRRRELRGVLAAAGLRGLGDLLSIGCGRGGFELMLAPHARRVTGIDLSPESIESAREHATREGATHVRFERADITDLELSEPFDTVLCIGLLHHLSEEGLVELLARIRQRLRPGGLLYTQDPSAKGILRRIGRGILGSHYDRYHSPDERELDPEAVRARLLETGFGRARIRYMDLTLIPGMQLLPTAPRWVMQGLDWTDRLWCGTPFARWASGFAVEATR